MCVYIFSEGVAAKGWGGYPRNLPKNTLTPSYGFTSSEVGVGRSFILEGHISRRHHEEGVMRAGILKSTAGEELSRGKAVVSEPRKMDRNRTFDAAVLACMLL